MEPKPEEIAKLAYRFYVEDGKPHDRADDHWVRAEEFLRHPEDHANTNVLAVPSEPELTPALDEKARDLDLNIPSDPHSSKEAVHQWVEIATDEQYKRRDTVSLQQALKRLPGIERVKIDDAAHRVRVRFDARRTNPAAIHEAIFDRNHQPSETP